MQICRIIRTENWKIQEIPKRADGESAGAVLEGDGESNGGTGKSKVRQMAETEMTKVSARMKRKYAPKPCCHLWNNKKWEGREEEMDWLSNELLFHGGAAAALISLVGACIFFLISRRGGKKLNAKLDEEYGKIDRAKKRK